MSQKRNFSPSWMTRGSPAAVIEPNPGAPSTPLGWARGGVLVRLKASTRTSITGRRPTGIRLMRARSTLR